MDGEGINPKVLKWFRSRGINPANVAHMGIYSGRRQQSGDSFEVVPDVSGEVIAFPYRRKGAIQNHKYREANKRFYQQPGGKKLFWNADVLDEPALHEGRAALVITEGELDALSLLEAGYPYVVSVPDGAPPPAESTEDIPDPEFDDKYRYIVNDWDALKKIKRIIIATDSDPPGQQLAKELIRRLGRARCSFVAYPEGCKDFNDVLMRGDMAVITSTLATAKPYPVAGVYRYSELPPEPDLVPVTTGFRRLDDLLMPFYPSLMVVTGMAGAGKSLFVNQMAAQMSILHGWKVALASFEMRIKPFVTDTLLKTYEGMRQDGRGERWLDDNFAFINPEPSAEDREFDIDWLIEKAIVAVVRNGIRLLIIDPWNEIEHAAGPRESLTSYTGRAIRVLKRFGAEFDCMVGVVAHPTKNAAQRVLNDPEKATDLSLYDVSDSAHWANKADLGLVLNRRGQHPLDFVTTLAVKKVRYQPMTGMPGSIEICFNPETRLFSQ